MHRAGHRSFFFLRPQVCIVELKGQPNALVVEMNERSEAVRAARALDGLVMPPHGIAMRVSRLTSEGARAAPQDIVTNMEALPKHYFRTRTAVEEGGNEQYPNRSVRLRNLPRSVKEAEIREWLGPYAHSGDRFYLFEEDERSRSAILDRSSIVGAVETILCRDAQRLRENTVRLDFAPQDWPLALMDPVAASGTSRDDGIPSRQPSGPVIEFSSGEGAIAFPAFAPPQTSEFGTAPSAVPPPLSVPVSSGWGPVGVLGTDELTPAVSLHPRSVATSDSGPSPSFAESVFPAADPEADLCLGHWSATPLAAPRDDMGR